MATTRSDLEEARLRLEGNDLCGKVILNATSRMRPESMLAYDGTNISQWIRDLKEIGGEHLSDPDFFFGPCNNSFLEKIGRAIILSTLQPEMKHEFQDYPSSHQIYKAIRNKFNNISRAGQMNIWRRFLSF